jgi:hypothetical protein
MADSARSRSALDAAWSQLRPVVLSVVRPLLLTKADRWFPSPLPAGFIHLAYLHRYSQWLRTHASEPKFESRAALYNHIADSENLRDAPVDYLEFGVFTGGSMKHWLKTLRNPEARFFGFDTFVGLPEQWGPGMPPGTFSTGGRLPDIDDSRCSFEVGLFQDTLFPLLDRYPLVRRKIVHLDADLYSATLFVLTALHRFFKPGDIIIFDELGTPRAPAEEFRAFQDYCAAYPIELVDIGSAEAYRQVAFRVG